MKKTLLSLSLLLMISCSSKNNIELGLHETRKLILDPSEQIMMDDSDYDIVGVISLKMPKDIPSIVANDIQIVNNRIYILDKEANKTVFMFDMEGNYICQLGRIGHARNEYIKRPECFSVSEITGIAYIYERASRRILRFDANGKFIEVLRLKDFVPEGVVVTAKENYLCCFENSVDGHGSQLSLYDKSGKHVKSFVPSCENHQLSMIGKTLFKDMEQISFLPFLADSVVIFHGDFVDYTIKIDFCGQFVPQEIREQSVDEGSYDPLFRHKGVQFIDQFELTDSLIHVGYSYNLSRSHFIKNRSNGKTFNTTSGPLFRGYSPVCDFFISSDKLLYLIDEIDVNVLLPNTDGEKMSQQTGIIRKYSKKEMLNIMDKKYKFPLIMMVKLK